MGVIVVGLGSMGRRRIRIIKLLYPNEPVIGVDTKEERRQKSAEEFEIKTYESIKDGLKENKVDKCFVCTSPSTHAAIISDALKYGLHIFSEINLIKDGYSENLNSSIEHNRVLFLSSTSLYKKEIEQIKKAVQRTRGKVFYNYHFGQYLPDWHPWEDYQNFFVGEKRTNGCRELFAIEMPWIISVFGEVRKYTVIRKKLSSLEISYDDSYLLQLEHKDGCCGMVAFDVVCREPVRHLEVYGEDIYLTWDGKPDGLALKNLETGSFEYPCKNAFYDSVEGYSALINEQGYMDEVKNFFQVVEGKESPRYSFKEDMDLLNWLDAIGI